MKIATLFFIVFCVIFSTKCYATETDVMKIGNNTDISFVYSLEGELVQVLHKGKLAYNLTK
jgi:hypothetical protein